MKIVNRSTREQIETDGCIGSILFDVKEDGKISMMAGLSTSYHYFIEHGEDEKFLEDVENFVPKKEGFHTLYRFLIGTKRIWISEAEWIIDNQKNNEPI